MDSVTQDFIAIALVLFIAGIAVLRSLKKPKRNGCESCKSNNKDPKSEAVIHFSKKSKNLE
jgi:hypothetical protein